MDVNEQFQHIRKDLTLVKSKVGDFAVYLNDNTVSLAIRLFGEYCDAEVEIMSKYLNEDSLYLDIGTNIGYHARGVQMRSGAKVIAFEPHPKHFAVAAYNCQNLPIVVYNTALGAKQGTLTITDFEADEVMNYGEVRATSEGVEVNVSKLDDFKLKDCTLMKIDVEGQELNVLKGAARTIKKFNPVIFYEAQELDVWTKCHTWLADRGYKQYWVTCRTKPIAPTFIPTDENPFGTSGVSNILAIHESQEQPDYLMEVVNGEDFNSLVNRLKRYILLY
jgi:FkbM family methyltransferase